jgi:hypothetical protein
MNDINTSILIEKNEELKKLLEEINDLFDTIEDEFLNSMFYSGLFKAKEFSNTLSNLFRKK